MLYLCIILDVNSILESNTYNWELFPCPAKPNNKDYLFRFSIFYFNEALNIINKNILI